MSSASLSLQIVILYIYHFLMLACTMEKPEYLQYLKLPLSDKIIAAAHTYYVPKERGTGIPFIIGEFGNTKAVANDERISQAVYLVQKAKEIGVSCLW